MSYFSLSDIQGNNHIIFQGWDELNLPSVISQFTLKKVDLKPPLYDCETL